VPHRDTTIQGAAVAAVPEEGPGLNRQTLAGPPLTPPTHLVRDKQLGISMIG